MNGQDQRNAVAPEGLLYGAVRIPRIRPRAPLGWGPEEILWNEFRVARGSVLSCIRDDGTEVLAWFDSGAGEVHLREQGAASTEARYRRLPISRYPGEMSSLGEFGGKLIVSFSSMWSRPKGWHSLGPIDSSGTIVLDGESPSGPFAKHGGQTYFSVVGKAIARATVKNETLICQGWDGDIEHLWQPADKVLAQGEGRDHSLLLVSGQLSGAPAMQVIDMNNGEVLHQVLGLQRLPQEASILRARDGRLLISWSDDRGWVYLHDGEERHLLDGETEPDHLEIYKVKPQMAQSTNGDIYVSWLGQGKMHETLKAARVSASGGPVEVLDHEFTDSIRSQSMICADDSGLRVAWLRSNSEARDYDQLVEVSWSGKETKETELATVDKRQLLPEHLELEACYCDGQGQPSVVWSRFLQEDPDRPPLFEIKRRKLKG